MSWSVGPAWHPRGFVARFPGGCRTDRSKGSLQPFPLPPTPQAFRVATRPERTEADRAQLFRTAAAFLIAYLHGNTLEVLAPTASEQSLLVDGLIYVEQGVAKTLATADDITTGQLLASFPPHDTKVLPGCSVEWDTAIDLVVGIEGQDSNTNPIAQDASERLLDIPTAINSAAAVAFAPIHALAERTDKTPLDLLDLLSRAGPY